MIVSKSDLRKTGIDKLKSYFEDPKLVKAIETKFDNISGKTGRYFVPITLFQKRSHRKNRALIPYEHVVKNKITYSMLKEFSNGVAVEFVNNEFFDEFNKPEDKQSELFKILKTKLGSDEIVSAIIDIRSTGSSSSEIQRTALENLTNFLNLKNLTLNEVLIKRKDYIKNRQRGVGSGNEKWQGFVYYNISGGRHDVIDSHVEAGIPSNRVQLFNPSVEFANEDTSLDITLVLIYFAFYSVQKEKRDEDWYDVIESYKEYFKQKKYNGISLFDYVTNHICLNLEEGLLIDPIQVEPIYIEDFTIQNREENSLDITHQTSVKKAVYVYDSDNDTILSSAHPTNLFWSKHLSNMMQQDFSLDEYFDRQREIIKKWDEYGISSKKHEL